MANLSNRNTSNLNTQSDATTAQTTYDPKTDPKSFYRMVVGAFTVGDAVLCPSIGNDSYTLQPNDIPCDDVMVTIPIKGFHHRFYKDGRINKKSPLPSLFHDTPANRQAVASLYDVNYPQVDALPKQPTDPLVVPLNPRALALELEDTLNLKYQQMSWLNSLLTAVSHLSKHGIIPQPIVDDLISIGSYLTMNFEIDTLEATEQLREAKEVAQWDTE